MYEMRINRYLSPEGDGGAGATDTLDDAAQLEVTELEGYLGKGEENLTPEEKVKYDALKTKYDYQAVGEDGKPLTEEQKRVIKDNEVKLKTYLAKPEAQRTPEEKKFITDN